MRTIAAAEQQSPGIRGPRVALLDAARGLAILAMVAYHVAWDLYILGFTSGDITTDPFWVSLQRGIVTSFLLLVGAGLVLAHGEGIRWRPFWRRFAVIVGAAALTSIGTAIVFPDYFVYFGILHAIAAFSLIGLAFVRAPLWVTAVAIGVVMVPPALITHPAMTAKPLSWIGFWPVPPDTTDIVPVFPWLGVVLCGILATRLLVGSPAWAGITRWRGRGAGGRALRWLGRWSLVIYLVHQPLIYGGLSLVAPQAAPAPDPIAFTRNCEETCRANGGEASFCARYCLCALEQIAGQSLWAEAAASPPGERILAVTRLCEAMAAD